MHGDDFSRAELGTAPAGWTKYISESASLAELFEVR